jgi:hypothetical protein
MSVPVPRVDISILSRGAILGSGGQGKVTEVKGLRIGHLYLARPQPPPGTGLGLRCGAAPVRDTRAQQRVVQV